MTNPFFKWDSNKQDVSSNREYNKMTHCLFKSNIQKLEERMFVEKAVCNTDSQRNLWFLLVCTLFTNKMERHLKNRRSWLLLFGFDLMNEAEYFTHICLEMFHWKSNGLKKGSLTDGPYTCYIWFTKQEADFFVLPVCVQQLCSSFYCRYVLASALFKM